MTNRVLSLKFEHFKFLSICIFVLFFGLDLLQHLYFITVGNNFGFLNLLHVETTNNTFVVHVYIYPHYKTQAETHKSFLLIILKLIRQKE